MKEVSQNRPHLFHLQQSVDNNQFVSRLILTCTQIKTPSHVKISSGIFLPVAEEEEEEEVEASCSCYNFLRTECSSVVSFANVTLATLLPIKLRLFVRQFVTLTRMKPCGSYRYTSVTSSKCHTVNVNRHTTASRDFRTCAGAAPRLCTKSVKSVFEKR